MNKNLLQQQMDAVHHAQPGSAMLYSILNIAQFCLQQLEMDTLSYEDPVFLAYEGVQEYVNVFFQNYWNEIDEKTQKNLSGRLHENAQAFRIFYEMRKQKVDDVKRGQQLREEIASAGEKCEKLEQDYEKLKENIERLKKIEELIPEDELCHLRQKTSNLCKEVQQKQRERVEAEKALSEAENNLQEEKGIRENYLSQIRQKNSELQDQAQHRLGYLEKNLKEIKDRVKKHEELKKDIFLQADRLAEVYENSSGHLKTNQDAAEKMQAADALSKENIEEIRKLESEIQEQEEKADSVKNLIAEEIDALKKQAEEIEQGGGFHGAKVQSGSTEQGTV